MRTFLFAGILFLTSLASAGVIHAQRQTTPTLQLEARPPAAPAPATIEFVGELLGGRDDNEEFYCVAVEWDLGDGTGSFMTPTCQPFEPGRSEIARRFVTMHTYPDPGRYEVRLTLTNGGRVLRSARTVVEVRVR